MGRSVSRRKFRYRLDRLMIVEDREVILIQVADELAMAISGDKKHVDFIDPFLEW